MIGSLDTNVILRRILGDAPEHQERAAALLASGTFRVSDAVVIEACFALARHYSFSRQQSATLLVGLLAQPGIDADTARFSAAFARYIEHPALSFEDCYLTVSAALDNHAPLFTFDRALAAQLDGAELVPELAN